MASKLAWALEATLRIRPGEQRRTALMAAYAANAIGAVVVGRSIRDALFLKHNGSRGLAWMYVASSAAIVATAWIYGRYADRVQRGTLNSATALLCALGCVVSWGLLNGGAGPWVYPALYIFVEVLGSLVVIQFWTLANDVFHAREAKRLFGYIGGGGTLANVVFGLLVGRFANQWRAQNLLFLMVAQLVLCAVLARIVARTVPLAPMAVRSTRKGIVLAREGVSVFSNRHLSIVAAIAAVSAAAVTIVDFQFKSAAAASMSVDELAGYFGRFYGICGGIALGVQIWVTGRVLERFGILASLLPLPAGLALGSAFSAVMPAPGLFVQSFAKGSDTIFRYTINDASMQLLYVPVKAHVRGRAKAFIDGILKPCAIALTGGALLLYRQLGDDSRPLTAAVLFLVSLWILLLVRARGEYVKSLVDSLEHRHLDFSSAPLAAQTGSATKALREALRSSDAATTLHALTLLPQASAAEFGDELLKLLAHEDPRLRAAALEQLGSGRLAGTLPALRARLEDPIPEVRAAALMAVCALEQEAAVATVTPFLDPVRAPETVVRAAAVVALVRHGGLDGILAAADALKGLLAAPDPTSRALACEALGQIGVRTFYRPLLGFLRDADATVRRKAIAAAGKLRSPELLSALIDAFEHRDTALEAAAALAAYGPGIEPHLARALADPSRPTMVRRSVALVLGRLPTREALDALIPGLHSRSRSVRRASGRALTRLLRKNRELGFDRVEVEGAVYDELKRARVALAALKKLQIQPLPSGQAPRTAEELLGLTLLEQRDAHVLQSLLLLEALVPQVRLDVVAENLRSESAASRGNAIEVLDQALPEPWKSLILATLDEVKRGSDQVLPDARSIPDLSAGLIGGEAGNWVAACTVRWAKDHPDAVGAALLDEALRSALSATSAPLREAAVAALASTLSAAEVAPVLRLLENDPAQSVRHTVAALLSGPAAKGTRASA